MTLFERALAVCLVATAAARADTLLVLPFANGSGDTTLDWVGESISETIREALASQGLMTLEREDRQEAFRRLGVKPYARLTRATVLKLATSLDADQVIYGNFSLDPPPAGAAPPANQSRGSLKITAHILDVRRLKQGPEFGEVGALEDLAVEQRHVAWQTLKLLSPNSAPDETAFQKLWPQVRVDAIENYIRGLLAQNFEQKHKLFSQAIRLEPEYSQAKFQLGMLLYGKKEYKTAADWLQKVAPTDPRSRQATFFLGLSRYYTGDYAAAQAAFEQVAKTVPLNEVLNNLGAAESRRNLPESLDNFSKALEGDANDPDYHFNVGYALWKQGKFDDAADRFRAALDRNPQDGEATLMLGRCLKRTPYRPTDLRESMERLKTNYEESAWWQLKAVLEPHKP